MLAGEIRALRFCILLALGAGALVGWVLAQGC